MKTRKLVILVLAAAIAAIGITSKVEAGPTTIRNGNFNEGSDGFDHWTVEPVTAGQVYTTGDGRAVMAEEDIQGPHDPVLLRFYQDFTLAADDGFVAFDLQIDSGDSGETDHFNAYLNDHRFCDWNNDDGPSYVDQPISYAIPSNLSGSTVRLAFELSFDGHNPLTAVYIGNVRTEPPVVPVPSAIVLAGLGLSLIMGYQLKSSKKQ